MFDPEITDINIQVDDLASILQEALDQLVGDDSIKSQDKLADFIAAQLQEQKLATLTYQYAIDVYLTEEINYRLNIVNSRGETLISSGSEIANKLTFYDLPIEGFSQNYVLEQAQEVLWDLLKNMAHPDDYFDMQLIAPHLPILDIAELKDEDFAKLSAVYPAVDGGTGATLEFETPFGIVVLDHVYAEDTKDVQTIIDNDLYEIVDIEKSSFGGYSVPRK